MQWAILSFFCCARLKMSGKELNITCIFNITLSSTNFLLFLKPFTRIPAEASAKRSQINILKSSVTDILF